MEVIDRLKRARIQIQRKNSFFGYLCLYLNFKEDKKCPSASIDNKGTFRFNPEWLGALSDDVIQGIVLHELLHLVFLHLLRRGARDFQLFNISADIVVNNLIVNNGYHLSSDGCVPKNNKIKIFGTKIVDIDKKTAEDVYAELEQVAKQQKKKGGGKGSSGDGEDDEEGDNSGERFDEHIEGDGKNGLSEEDKKKFEKEWLSKVQEAVTISKMKGDVPVGMERLVERLNENKVDWRKLLMKFIQAQIPYDYSFRSPSKRSIAVGTYLPCVEKEKIEVCFVVDLSGSIGEEEMTDFLSEMAGIVRTFNNRIDFRLITHETEVNEDYVVRCGTIDKLMELKMSGGGGTSFQGVLKHIEENGIKPKCVLWLSDGYGDRVEKQSYPIMWVLSKGGSDELIKESGEVLKLE